MNRILSAFFIFLIEATYGKIWLRYYDSLGWLIGQGWSNWTECDAFCGKGKEFRFLLNEQGNVFEVDLYLVPVSRSVYRRETGNSWMWSRWFEMCIVERYTGSSWTDHYPRHLHNVQVGACAYLGGHSNHLMTLRILFFRKRSEGNNLSRGKERLQNYRSALGTNLQRVWLDSNVARTTTYSFRILCDEWKWWRHNYSLQCQYLIFETLLLWLIRNKICFIKES